MPCPLEDRLLHAMRSGSFSPEMQRHSEVCPDCREALQLAEALLADAALLQSQSAPPPAAQVWATAQSRQRTAAPHRSTRFLRVLKTAGWL